MASPRKKTPSNRAKAPARAAKAAPAKATTAKTKPASAKTKKTPASTRAAKAPASKAPASTRPAKTSGRAPASTRQAKAPASSKAPASKATRAAKLTDEQVKALRALGPSLAEPIDLPVANIAHEARELEAVVDRLGARLIEGSRLDAALCSSLRERRLTLEAAEQDWLAQRLSQLPADQQKMEQAERLKRDLIAALRYFLHSDEGVQARVDDIIPGTGLVDLIDDLQKLAALAREHSAELRRADLPPRAAALAEQLAEELGADSAARELARSTDSARRQDLRNRAFWWLRQAMDEIRAAGRYVFRDDPRTLVLFRASTTRARKQTRKPARPGSPAR